MKNIDVSFNENDEVTVTGYNDHKKSVFTVLEAGEYLVRFSATNDTKFPIQIDPKATGTKRLIEYRKWIRRGDLVIDENTGDYIPIRKLTKEQLEMMLKKDGDFV